MVEKNDIVKFEGEEAKKMADSLGEPLVRINIYKDTEENLGIMVDAAKNEDVTPELMMTSLKTLCEQFGMMCVPINACVGIAVFEKDSGKDSKCHKESIPQ